VALLNPHSAQPGQLAGLKGRRVKVHGLIRLYQGQPEIVVQEASEIVPVE
jgi:DNA/RNA endonuclease YhcR with UshA esterase domain